MFGSFRLSITTAQFLCYDTPPKFINWQWFTMPNFCISRVIEVRFRPWRVGLFSKIITRDIEFFDAVDGAQQLYHPFLRCLRAFTITFLEASRQTAIVSTLRGKCCAIGPCLFLNTLQSLTLEVTLAISWLLSSVRYCSLMSAIGSCTANLLLCQARLALSRAITFM